MVPDHKFRYFSSKTWLLQGLRHRPKHRITINVKLRDIGVNVKAGGTELDAIKTAIDKEKKSYDFYEHQCQNATYDAGRDYYEALAGEKREHELIILDYYEYLADPVDWFT